MPAVLFAAFLLVPIVEIAVILQVGQLIGGWQTAVLLLVMSAFGAWIVRREGRRAWRALRAAVASGRVPAREAADGALVLVGGTLLLTPGFVTDAVGLALVLPASRAVVRRLLTRWAARRVGLLGGPGGAGRRPARRGAGPVVPGEVIDPDDPGRRGSGSA